MDVTGGILSAFHVRNARPIIENSCTRPPPSTTDVQLKPSTRAKRDSITLSLDTPYTINSEIRKGQRSRDDKDADRSDVIAKLKACVVTWSVIGGYVIGRGLAY